MTIADDDEPAGVFDRMFARLPPGILRRPGDAERDEAEAAAQPAIRYVTRRPSSIVPLRRDQPVPKPATPHAAPCVVDPTTLEGVCVPERRWIVPAWLPVGYATLCYGEGGTSKTLLSQQLMTAAATGTAWLGLPVEPCRSYALFCEDDESEMFTRQAAINTRIGASFADLGNMRWCCPIGQDNVLIRFSRSGEPQLTERFHWLRGEVLGFGARLVVLDTAATTFGGNEIDRAQTTAYVGQVLTSLAQEIDGAVLLNAHPSRAGKATGSGDSGSTAWSASARSRWYLARPPADGGGEDQNARTLTRVKANGASAGETIPLRWRDWFLERRGQPSGDGTAAVFGPVNRQLGADALFLTLLERCDEANMPLSTSKNAGNYAPRIFVKRADAEGYTARDFDAAMHRLLTGGRIVLANYGRAGDERRRLAFPADAPDGGEAATE
jgi:AAA domain